MAQRLSRLRGMAATYSSFMTTRFYSPVFNTALFDGPFRIYFSQAYESAALKFYHLLQSERQALWNEAKAWSLKNKEHVFLLIYPDQKSVNLVFTDSESVDGSQSLFMQDWEEGLALGICQPTQDQDIYLHLDQIERSIKEWLQK